MNHRIFNVLAIVVLVAGLSYMAYAQNQKTGEGAAAPAPAAGNLSLEQKVSYAIGFNIGQSMKQDSIILDVDQFITGLRSALAGEKNRMSDEELQQTFMAYQKKMMDEMQAKNKSYLTDNAKKPGVKTTASGLQYKVIKEGNGPMPGRTDKVTVHYEGKLVDGTVFDSSYQRGQPTSFPVNGVIEGWTEALLLMKVGSKYELAIPSELGYKERGAGQMIPPNATLIFTVELLNVEKGDEAPAAPAAPATE